MEIRSARLLIRPIRFEDWKSLQKIWIDLSKSEYAQYDTPHPLEDGEVKARIQKIISQENRFAVCLPDEDAMIGYVVFHEDPGALDIGYCFDADYQGKGYAKESIETLLEHLRKQGVRRFTAGTGLKNTPSLRLLHALGFRQIATEKVSFYKDANGDPIYFDGGIFERN